MSNKADQTVHVIGFDLGHGESALSWLYTEQIANEQGKIIPKSYGLQGKKSEITALAYLEDGTPVFGEYTLTRPGVERFEIAFKRRPGLSPQSDRAIQDFAKAVYNYLLQTNTDSITSESYFFVGRPSGWESDTNEAYRKLLQDTGLPHVHVVPESRAALAQISENGLLTEGELKKPTLIIDIGSSTTDLTLIDNSQDKPFDTGEDVGAGLIEKIIFARLLEALDSSERERIETVFNAQPMLRAKCELHCRRAKEEYFSLESTNSNPTIERDVRLGTKSGVYFNITIDKSFMDLVLRQPVPLQILSDRQRNVFGSIPWGEMYRRALVEAKQTIEKRGTKIANVVMTGGSSKMRFVREITKEVFGIQEDKHLRRDTEPELTIANGLARWGRRDIKSQRFHRDIEDFLNKELDSLVSEKTPELFSSLANTIAKTLAVDIVKPQLRAWRNGSISTLNQLESKIRSEVKKKLEGAASAEIVDQVVQGWIRDLTPTLRQKITKIGEKHEITPESITLKIKMESAKANDYKANLGEDPTGLAATINMVIAVVVGVVVLALIASVIGALIAGVATALIGYPTIESIIRDTDIPSWARGWFLSDDKIDEIVSDQQTKIKNSVESEMKKDKKRKDTIKDSAVSAIRDAVREGIRFAKFEKL